MAAEKTPAAEAQRRLGARRGRVVLAAQRLGGQLYLRQERLLQVVPYLESSKPEGPCPSRGRHDPPEVPAWRSRRKVESHGGNVTNAGKRWGGRGAEDDIESRYDKHNRHSTFCLRVETRRPPEHRPDGFFAPKDLNPRG